MRTVIDEFDLHAIQRAVGLEPQGPQYRKDEVECVDGFLSAFEGCHHTEETKKILSESHMGMPAWNKGLPNPEQRERFLHANPMKNPEIAKKVSDAQKGRPGNNRITKTYTKVCKECGRKEDKRDTKHNRINVFCGKSCAARWFNMNGRVYDRDDK